MKQQDQAIQTDGQRQFHEFFNLTMKDVLTLIASQILPLVLGVYAITSANNQQKEIIRQNERDGLLRRQE